MEKQIFVLTKLIQCAVTDNLIDENTKAIIDNDMLESIYKKAELHVLTHLVAYGLWKCGLLDEQTEIGRKYSHSMLKANVRQEKLNYEYGRICKLLESNEIKFIPLKGAVLRNLYPETWMRLSCDIDILIHPNDLNTAVDLINRGLNYSIGKRGEYDMSLFSENGVHLELHFGIMEKMFKGSSEFERIWSSATPISEGSMQMAMSDDVFYYHHILHMAKHFEANGCGIRFFLDTWMFNNSKEVKLKGEYKKMLSDIGLLKFEEASRKLSNVWFSNEEHNRLTKNMQGFIVKSGIYGTSDNYFAFMQIRHGGKTQYAKSRILLPYEKMLEIYPVLSKHKWLLPFYQIRRWTAILIKGRLKSSVKELKDNSEISEEYVKKVKSLFDSLGIN